MEVRVDDQWGDGPSAGLPAEAKSVGDRVSSGDAVVSAAAIRYVGASRSTNTARAYAADWARFSRWCQQQAHNPLPADPGTVANYLAEHADLLRDDGTFVYAPSTMSRWVATINGRHREAGFLPPGAHEGVARVLAGIRRDRASPPKRAEALGLTMLRTVLDAIPRGGWPQALIGRRDTAILLMGFAGAFRRSELSGLVVDNVVIHLDDGLRVRLATSKTDQEAAGAVVALPYGHDPVTCPPCAYARWLEVLSAVNDLALEAAGTRTALMRQRLMRIVLDSFDPSVHVCRLPSVAAWRSMLPALMPVFSPVTKSGAVQRRALSADTINAVVRRRIRTAGMSADGFSAHSLRAGFITDALTAGADYHSVMRQTRHKRTDTVELYARERAPLVNNAVTRLGL